MARGAAITLVAAAACATALANPARVLDDKGRVLTVGNWRTNIGDGGVPQKVLCNEVLSWELRDGQSVVGGGVVPGSEDALVDGQPVLSRDSFTDTILLAWSRQSQAGSREIVLQWFNEGAWSVDVPLASASYNQVDPSVVHDGEGNARIAWRSMDWEQRVYVATIAPDGSVVAQQDLSNERSVLNGAPKLGVDACGEVFVAFLGRDTAASEPRVFVMGELSLGGGVIHVPSPVIELAQRASVPTPSVLLGQPGAPTPDVHVEVLGGTPVIWWTETVVMGEAPNQTTQTFFRHVYEDELRGWAGSELHSIDISPTAMDGGAQEALGLLADRLRRVTSRFRVDAPGPGAPIVRPTLDPLRRR
jgi:hypothetical protein